MRILYGVVGEGLGHAMRALVVAPYLVSQGHEVRVFASGRAYNVLAAKLAHVQRIEGLSLHYTDNRINKGKTAWSNLKNLAPGLSHNVGQWLELLAGFEPDVVLSDFESWTWLCARVFGLPIVSLDNIQVLSRCDHPRSIRKGHEADFQIARQVVKGKLPGCDHYLISTFIPAAVSKKRTTLVPPLLRPAVLDATPVRGDHVVVYQSGPGCGELSDLLGKHKGTEFRIYGARPELLAPEVEGHLHFMPYSESNFLTDLISCRAVVASAGHTLMTEALHLGKPMLALPLEGQFEQMLNARWLAHLGLGLCSEKPRPRDVGELLERDKDLSRRLAREPRRGNQAALHSLQAILHAVT
jgi:uncharacterized protein (TIGR00661 family)